MTLPKIERPWKTIVSLWMIDARGAWQYGCPMRDLHAPGLLRCWAPRNDELGTREHSDLTDYPRTHITIMSEYRGPDGYPLAFKLPLLAKRRRLFRRRDCRASLAMTRDRALAMTRDRGSSNQLRSSADTCGLTVRWTGRNGNSIGTNICATWTRRFVKGCPMYDLCARNDTG
jgi:hypothetical protein